MWTGAFASPFEPSALVIAGVNTHACVQMTAIDAYQRDYEVIIARDAVASYDQRHYDVSIDYLDGEITQVLGNEAILLSLDAPV
jgi:isochorismate hydrolase